MFLGVSIFTPSDFHHESTSLVKSRCVTLDICYIIWSKRSCVTFRNPSARELLVYSQVISGMFQPDTTEVGRYLFTGQLKKGEGKAGI